MSNSGRYNGAQEGSSHLQKEADKENELLVPKRQNLFGRIQLGTFDASLKSSD